MRSEPSISVDGLGFKAQRRALPGFVQGDSGCHPSASWTAASEIGEQKIGARLSKFRGLREILG